MALVSKITFTTFPGVVGEPGERKAGKWGQVGCLLFSRTFQTFETRHGEVRVWQLPAKAQILIMDGGGDEEGKGKDAKDEEDFVKQEQDSKEFIALQEEENLIKMNVPREVTDSKGLPMEEIIKQEEEEEIIKQEDEEEGIKQEEEEEKDRSETDVEVWQDSRPLHYHPISTSVSGWLAEKI